MVIGFQNGAYLRGGSAGAQSGWSAVASDSRTPQFTSHGGERNITRRIIQGAPLSVTPVEPKPLPFVIGAWIVAPLIQRAATLAGRISQLFVSSPCYDEILADHPGMDETSQEAVGELCQNSADELVISGGNLNEPGIQGIRDALERNTQLDTLSLSQTYCDTPTLATEFSTALKINRKLRRLILIDVGDSSPSNIKPPPMKPSAIQIFGRNLQCSSLRSLDLGFVDLNVPSAQTLASAFNDTFFPLSDFYLSWQDNGQPMVEPLRVLADGFGKSHCLTTIGIGAYRMLSKETLLSMFRAIGNSTISTLSLWCPQPYDFNETEVLGLLQSSRCWNNYTWTLRSCFSPDLAQSFDQIARDKAPCVRSEQCEIPKNCTEPAIATSAQSKNFTETLSFQVPVAVAGALGFLSGFVCWNKRKKADREARRENELTVAPQGARTHIPLARIRAAQLSQEGVPGGEPSSGSDEHSQGEV